MDGLPLHPALVHLPLGLAMIMPLVLAPIAWARARGRTGRPGWALAVALQAVLLGGAFAAGQTGEQDEEVVERVVSESAIHEHEEAAELFIVVTGVTFGVVLLAWILSGTAATVASALAFLMSIGVLVLGLQVGHAGGELVYRHGAASAHAPGGAPPASRHEDHDDDD